MFNVFLVDVFALFGVGALEKRYELPPSVWPGITRKGKAYAEGVVAFFLAAAVACGACVAIHRVVGEGEGREPEEAGEEGELHRGDQSILMGLICFEVQRDRWPSPFL